MHALHGQTKHTASSQSLSEKHDPASCQSASVSLDTRDCQICRGNAIFNWTSTSRLYQLMAQLLVQRIVQSSKRRGLGEQLDSKVCQAWTRRQHRFRQLVATHSISLSTKAWAMTTACTHACPGKQSKYTRRCVHEFEREQANVIE